MRNLESGCRCVGDTEEELGPHTSTSSCRRAATRAGIGPYAASLQKVTVLYSGSCRSQLQAAPAEVGVGRCSVSEFNIDYGGAVLALHFLYLKRLRIDPN